MTTKPTNATEATKEIKAAVTRAVNEHTGPEVSPVKAEAIAAVAVEDIKTDPVSMNATNQEPWYQSGVGVFGAGGIIWSLGFLLGQVGEHGATVQDYDLEQTVNALGTLGMFGMVLYRRFMPGLKPLFWWMNR